MWKDKSIHLAFINKIERGDKPRYVAVFKASFYDKNKKKNKKNICAYEMG